MSTSLNANFPQFNVSPMTVNLQTGQCAWDPAWFRFLINLFQRTGGTLGQDPTEIEYAEIQSTRPGMLPQGLSDEPIVASTTPDLGRALAALADQVATMRPTPVPRLVLARAIYPALTLIQLWVGAVGSIPTGWQLCDGTNGTPNMENLFVIGAGGTYAVGATGGSTTISADQLPAHTHGYDKATATTLSTFAVTGAATAVVSLTQTDTPSDANTPVGAPYLPPYYAVAYIINTAIYTVITNAEIRE